MTETTLLDAQPAQTGLDENLSEGRLVLPGGILWGGRCLKIAYVRQLTGADEELLAARAPSSGARRVTEFLARVLTRVEGLDMPVDEDLVSSMLIGDRDYLLLRLRQMALGDVVEQVLRCRAPGCGRKADVEFLISELSVNRAPSVEARYALRLTMPAFADDETSQELVLRLPAGRDQEAVAGLEQNPSAMNTRLFARIVLEAGRRKGLDEAQARELPLRVREEMRRFLRATAPGPDLTVEVQCPSCGEDMSYSFDLHSFFLPAG